MHKDAIVFETGRLWRYYCDEPGCPYICSQAMTLPAVELAQRVHRHRHVVGRNGVYHRAST